MLESLGGPDLMDEPRDGGAADEPVSPLALTQVSTGNDPRVPPDGGIGQASLAAPERYVLGREIGRGGLGRVVLALDRNLMGRQVAMKLLLRAAPTGRTPSGAPSARERFVSEARITGQLQHPNIVPLHEMGELPTGEIYYTMAVASGRTLHAAIRDAHARLAEARIPPEGWGLERLSLLAAFQGLCNALAYAHSRGVVHRDIKPSNVMVGDYGETIVLDWGLAKVIRGEAGALLPEAHDDARGADLELGELIARTTTMGGEGQRTMDGTVTGTPAYMSPEQASGRIAEIDERSDIYALGAVLLEILTGRPPFEGETIAAILAQVTAPGPAPDPRLRTRAPVPDDLAEVCMTAMAREKSARFGSVQDLLASVTAAIEGGKERQRSHERCMEKLAEARRLVGEHRRLMAAVDVRRLELEAARDGVAAYERLDDAAGGKRRKLRAELAVEDTVRMADDASNAALVALAEALHHEPENEVARREMAGFHYADMLRAEQRRNRKELELHKAQVALYDDGAFRERLQGDGTLTVTTRPAGARATLYRYEEKEWILEALHHSDLGATPVAGVSLPMGSYLLVLEREGYRETRAPFVVGRLEAVALDVVLRTDEEIGAGMVYVPSGKFLMGDREDVREVALDDFFIAEYPVTFGEYCEYLDWLEEHRPAEARQRAPQNTVDGVIVRKDALGRYVPFDPAPADGASSSGDPRLPVLSISWYDAGAYAAWLSERRGREYRLPLEKEWEKASRGADGRRFPWGERFDPSLCKMALSRQGAPQPEPVGTFATDVSPYGVRDTAGGVTDWCDGWFDGHRTLRSARGGAWGLNAATCAFRGGYAASLRFANNGFRLAASPRAATPPPAPAGSGSSESA